MLSSYKTYDVPSYLITAGLCQELCMEHFGSNRIFLFAFGVFILFLTYAEQYVKQSLLLVGKQSVHTLLSVDMVQTCYENVICFRNGNVSV